MKRRKISHVLTALLTASVLMLSPVCGLNAYAAPAAAEQTEAETEEPLSITQPAEQEQDLAVQGTDQQNADQTQEEMNQQKKQVEQTDATPEQSGDNDAQQETGEDASSASETQEEEKTEEDLFSLVYAAVATPEITAPMTEEIAVGLVSAEGASIDAVDLLYCNEEKGETYTVQASVQTDGGWKFEIPFAAGQEGTYTLISIGITSGETVQTIVFADLGMEPKFAVDKAVETDPDAYYDGDTEELTDAEEVQAEEETETQSSEGQQDTVYVADDQEEVSTEDSVAEGLEAAGNTAETPVLRSRAAMSVNSRTAANTDKAYYTVVLDPGHGGTDPGAVGQKPSGEQLTEAYINQTIADYCADALSAYPWITVLKTRNSLSESLHGSISEDLVWRTDFAEENGADLFFCIHVNAAGSSSATGVEVYYPNANYREDLHELGQTVAQFTQDNLTSLGMYDRGIKIRNSETGDTYPDGSLSDYLSVIRNCKTRGIPAVLVEHGFLSNPSDVAKFFNDTMLKKIGEADAEAIVEYFTAEFGVPEQSNVTMYRLYNPYSGEHLYTKDRHEVEVLTGLGWRDEGTAWIAPSYSATPVYRLYNPNNGDHHYTTDRNERNELVKLGWNAEGIGWFSAEEKTVPIYRLFNPYTTVSTHLYTKDQNEYNELKKIGWRQEGVAWYGLSA